jgi:hypothetical protein
MRTDTDDVPCFDQQMVSREIVAKFFPLGMKGTWSGTLDALVDRIVVRCSRENILDDAPTHDPRWRACNFGKFDGYPLG